jgi:hypothetical protein
MKKLLLILVFFIGLTPKYYNGQLQLDVAQKVYAQSQTGCWNPNSGGGFWNWLGNGLSAIGNAIGNAVSAVGNAIGSLFSGGGGDGEGIGDENGDDSGDDWEPDGDGGYVPDFGGSGGPSFDPWNDPFFQNYGFDPDEWAILNNLGYFYNYYVNNSGGTNNPPPCPTSVTYAEDPTQKYGFDNYTNAAVPWKSVEQNQSDKLKVTITPATSYSTVFFNSADATKVTVTPANATSAAFDLTATSATGLNKVDTEIQANCGSATGVNVSKFNVASYTLVTKTVAVILVHSQGDGAGYAGFNSTDVSDADIENFLNNTCYNQGVVKWTITRKAAKVVNFDLNKDGKIDTDTWMTAEMAKVRDEAKYDTYDLNVFLVDNGSFVGGTGFADFGQRYVYVHANLSSRPVSTIAHEMGHAGFSFPHSPVADTENIMYESSSTTKYRLRKNQWDAMH